MDRYNKRQIQNSLLLRLFYNLPPFFPLICGIKWNLFEVNEELNVEEGSIFLFTISVDKPSSSFGSEKWATILFLVDDFSQRV